jgi:hypothetical protein
MSWDGDVAMGFRGMQKEKGALKTGEPSSKQSGGWITDAFVMWPAD